MAWTLTLNPIWAVDFPYLVLDYKLDGAPPDKPYAPFFMSDDSTGPVTPGATNPENPSASGGSGYFGESTPGRHRLVVDLRETGVSDRVSRITAFVHADSAPTTLHLYEISFWSRHPFEADAEAAVQTVVPVEKQSALRTGLVALDLGEATVTAYPPPVLNYHQIEAKNRVAPVSLLLRELGLDSAAWPQYAEDFAPTFDVPGQSALTTGIMQRESVHFSGNWHGTSLHLLLGLRLSGSDRPWYSPASYAPRTSVDSPDHLRVILTYDDNTLETSLPERADARETDIDEGLAHYLVPLDGTKALKTVDVIDGMDFGQIFLLAASIDQNHDGQSTEATDTLPAESEAFRLDVEMVRDGESLNVSAPGYKARFKLTSGLEITELHTPWQTASVIEAPVQMLQVFDGDGTPLALHLAPDATDQPKDPALIWRTDDEAIEISLTIAARTEDIEFTPHVTNRANTEWHGSVHFPCLPGVRIGSGADISYLLGTRTATLSSQPVTVHEPYGGKFPLPLMDVFDSAGRGGLGVIVRDTELHRKWFTFEHTVDERSNLRVEFPHLLLAPGDDLGLPTTILAPHHGDWHATFNRYRAWANAAFPAGGSDRMAPLYYCRRDYPLGGTDYLYDRRAGQYSFDDLIEESVRAFGDIDMVDISGWAYNEEIGRVGTYLENDLGGLTALKDGIATAHARGVQVGLYFEGYLVDRRSAWAEAGLPAWQIIRQDGTGVWWSAEMEFFCCPGVTAWREQFTDTVVTVAETTRADAVYVDQFGICDAGKECWAADHGHAVPSNPLREETEFLRLLREKLDACGLHTAIYIEHVPCDAMVDLVDGVFNAAALGVDATHGTALLPLHRFVFPQLATFQMPAHGIRPIPAPADEIHRAFFYGLGLWLKGRGDSWFDADFRYASHNYAPLYERLSDILSYGKADPLLPTLVKGVAANTFRTGDALLVTLYNTRPVTVSGPLFVASVPAEWTFEPLNSQTASAKADGDGGMTVEDAIAPKAVKAYVFRKHEEE